MTELKKQLGTFDLVALSLGVIIDTGIFFLLALLWPVSGPSLILAMILAGVIPFFLMMVYAELGSSFPLEGGPYIFPRMALGDFVGVLSGWAFIFFTFFATAGIIHFSVMYLGLYFPVLSKAGDLSALGMSVAVIFLWTLTFINILGVRWGSLVNKVMIVIKLLFIFIFCVVALKSFKGENFIPFFPEGFGGCAISLPMLFLLYTGFEVITIVSAEVKHPKKSIPLAFIFSFVITFIAYIAIAVVFVGFINVKEFSFASKSWQELTQLSLPVEALINLFKGSYLAPLIMFGVVVFALGTASCRILAQGRMPFAMSKDRLFLSSLKKIHPKYQTPFIAMIFTSTISTCILLFIPHFFSMVLIGNIFVLIMISASALALPILRETRTEIERPFKIPFAKFFSLIIFILSALLIYWVSWPWTLFGGMIFLTGYPVYFLVRNKKENIQRSLWLPILLFGIVFISYLGNPGYLYQKFGKLQPIGYISFPYDLIVLIVFSTGIYFWALYANIKIHRKQLEKTSAISDINE